MLINHFKEIVDGKGLYQRDVVRGTGLAINTVAGLYNNTTKRVDFDTLNKVCKFLGVSVGEILEYKEDEEAAGDETQDH